MSVEGEYELKLTCDKRFCQTFDRFTAPTRMEAKEKAREANWLLTRHNVATCPKCREKS